MINSGDKNTNVVEIINNLKGTKYPTNDGVDDYTMNEPYEQYPRDPREHNPLKVINSDETKPLDKDDINQRVARLENLSRTVEEVDKSNDIIEINKE